MLAETSTPPERGPVRLRRERDFGGVVSDSITLLVSHGRTFFPALLAIVAVPLMLQALGELQGESPEGVGVLLSLVGSLAGAAAGVFVVTGSLGFALAVDEDPDARVTPGALWGWMDGLFWPIFALQWVTGIAVALVALLFLLPGIVADSIPGMVAGGVVVLALLTAAAPGLGLSVPARVLDSDSVFGALRRGFELSRGAWKQTFGVVVVTYGIAIVAWLVPMGALGGAAAYVTGGEEQSLVLAAALMIGSLGYVSFALPTVASLVQYFNLVERREAPLLNARVQEIGHDEVEEPLF